MNDTTLHGCAYEEKRADDKPKRCATPGFRRGQTYCVCMFLRSHLRRRDPVRQKTHNLRFFLKKCRDDWQGNEEDRKTENRVGAASAEVGDKELSEGR